MVPESEKSVDTEATKTTCFVIMPFGQKPFPDGTGRTYDFDKVYRIIIQRAIRQAGMIPVRADESVGAALIHTDMFKELRDRAVVLADLSLENPNVFYELGIRHVMSQAGTVLICRDGSTLPFDVRLSRVIFYKYDGLSLDYEEVERVVPSLQLALEHAKEGLPDSPVHALLDRVLQGRDEVTAATDSADGFVETSASLEHYQRLIACFWRDSGRRSTELYEENRKTIFGARALGYYFLEEPTAPQAPLVAAYLADVEQYELAIELFARLRAANRLQYRDLLRYASAWGEAHGDLDGANAALALVDEAMDAMTKQFGESAGADDAEAAHARAQIYRRQAGLIQWKWQLTQGEADLDAALAASERAITAVDHARQLGTFPHPGLLAQTHLKRMLLLRIKDRNVNRPDLEGHRDAVMRIKPLPGDVARGISYLNWFQAIALADAGAEEQSRRKALAAFAEDARIMDDADNVEVGRRQYRRLRRFLTQYSHVLKNPSLIGGISQILQSGHGAKPVGRQRRA